MELIWFNSILMEDNKELHYFTKLNFNNYKEFKFVLRTSEKR